MLERLARLWAGSSRGGTSEDMQIGGSNPAKLLTPIAEAIMTGDPGYVQKEVKASVAELKTLWDGVPSSARDCDQFDKRFAGKFVGGYLEMLGTAARHNCVGAYIGGLRDIGEALHPLPHAAGRFAKGLVDVHREVAENAGEDLAAQVRLVQSGLLKADIDDQSPLKVALRAHSFDGRAVGPAQVAGTVAATPN